ncbi:MAG: hypothetical protein PHU63_04150 [Candidatus ainarchaeum sp.]|nr:hypothetical protein [Candidatus ainarchaeum sp.]
MKKFKEDLSTYLIGGIIGFSIFFSLMYSTEKRENKLLRENLRWASFGAKSLEAQVENLQSINESAIQEMYEKLGVMEKRLPGIGNMFNSATLFLDKTRRFNDAPGETSKVLELIQEAQLYPENLDRLQLKYMHDAHGIQNYQPTYPFLKIPFEESALVYASSDRGLRKNIEVSKTGKEKYLGTSMHEGYDLVSTDKRVIAKYDYQVVLYDDFHRFPEGNRYKELYGGGGELRF